MAPPTPRAKPSGRSTAEDLEGGENLQRSGREEAGPWVMALPDPKINLPGREILSPQRLAAATAGSSGHRDMQGRACGTRKEAGSRPIHSKRSPRRRTAPDLAPGPSQPCLAASRGRYRHQQPIAQSTTVRRADESRVHARARIRDQRRYGQNPRSRLTYGIHQADGCRLEMLDSHNMAGSRLRWERTAPRTGNHSAARGWRTWISARRLTRAPIIARRIRPAPGCSRH